MVVLGDKIDVIVSERCLVELEEAVGELTVSVKLVALRIAVVASLEEAGNVDREVVPGVDGSDDVEEIEVTS